MRKHDLGARWFFCRLPRPQPCIRLLCFPQAGGLTTLFHAWPELLPSAVEVLVAQLPGRERRRGEPLLTDLDVLTSGFVEALGSYLDRPIAIFGHSAGALIGFEVARRLQRQGQPPRHLFVSARRAPHLPSPDPPVHQMPLDVFLSGLERRCGPLPAAVRDDPELLQLFLPIIRADATLLERHTYVPSEPLACPLTAYGGTADASVTLSELEAWQTETRLDFKLRLFAGDHFFPQTARDDLLADLSARLATCSLPPSGSFLL